jgi:flavorubredoxin
MPTVHPVADGIYRISTFDPAIGISFNQFLIPDDKPTLIHTGTFPAYESVRGAVAQILDPKTLAYIVVPHFEADECGGMSRFIQAAPSATLLCSEMGAAINFSAWDFQGPFKGMRDNDTVDLGKHKLRFWETPHVHHWDSMMVFEETTRSLFPADLFIQPGDQPATITENLGQEMCALYRGAGIFAGAGPVLDVINRVEKTNPQIIHPMHGGSFASTLTPHYLNALRTTPFVYEGMLLGRSLLG